MTTKNLDKKDRNELVDFGVRLSQACWEVYSRSDAGFPRIFMLPNDDVRRRANQLFHLGFCARLFRCPSSDAAVETDGEMLWNDYLSTMNGKRVLGFGIYPDTPEFILNYAKHFFIEGFHAGTIAVREIFKS